MTLGGLALAIGMLVDDATVRDREHPPQPARGKRLPSPSSMGSQQIRAAGARGHAHHSAWSSSRWCCSKGRRGSSSAPLALGVVISMLASYLLSRTLVPTLSRLLMEKEDLHYRGEGFAARFNRWRDARFSRVQQAYGRALSAVLAHRGMVLGSAPWSFCAPRRCPSWWGSISSPPSTPGRCGCTTGRRSALASRRRNAGGAARSSASGRVVPRRVADHQLHDRDAHFVQTTPSCRPTTPAARTRTCSSR